MARALPRYAASGFTLIEVLVAMFVMAIVATMAWQGVDGIVRTRDASQGKLEQLLRLNTVMAQFEQDLSAVQDSGVLPQAMPAFDGISMRLTRRTPEGLQLVVWSLRGGSWLRWAGPSVTTTQALQENWLATQQFLGNEAGQLRTLSGVSDWQAYCFRGNAWSNCQSSAGSADNPSGGGANPPPVVSSEPLKGVRVVLSFAEGSGFAGSITREIALGPQ